MSASRLDVAIEGRGRDLVLLHSLLSDRTSFEPLVGRIAGERRLILVNLPGFGASPPAGPALGDYADAIAGVFDDLALPPATDVLGNGLGGFVALNLASRHRARFARMVLVGSAIAFADAGRATFRALAALDLSAELARIANPTLIVVGAEDQATPPALGRALANRLANATLVELPGLGHCPHIQDPDAFVAAIAPFLGLGADRPGSR
ncbi:MAG TPA: alpha/beta fold hydrolase [Geminicoccaceae bacterium]|nr:alpha/beta fold hydrolase [Geminicoccaceae bacterium]